MRQRLFLIALTVLGTVLPVFHPSSTAQVRFTPASSSEIDRILQRGLDLERRRKWGDALTHYEDALRDHPNHPALQKRLDLSKIQYGVGRRYADESFLTCLRTLTEDEALELYGEVLLKIQSHYVDEPDWQALADLGTHGVKVALGNEDFADRHLQNVPKEWTDNFLRDTRGRVEILGVRTRHDALETARLMGRLGRRHLGVAPTAVIMEYIHHAVVSLDPYSSYLTPRQLSELFSQIDGNFVGLGVELQSEDGYLMVVDVIEGSPAAESGLKAGDRILAAGGRSMKGLSTDRAASMLQGSAGSIAQVSIQSPNQPAREVRITRRRIDVPSVEKVQIINRELGVGYLELNNFQKTSPRELDKALWKLHRLGMRSLIMDLRGNPGGLLTTAVEVADRFIPSGRIVSTKGRSPDQNWTYSAHKSKTWQTPLIVLIDEDSASAAEIFAGAIRDHRRGYLIGRKSYGKGSVQSIFSLTTAKSGLRLTTAKFYSPTGRAYSKVGVTPHITVRTAAKPVNGRVQPPVSLSEDPAVKESVRVARERF
ncbi:MAG: S41 family peptidase [Planctomycetales bacterium]